MGCFDSSTNYSLPKWTAAPTALVSAKSIPLINKTFQSYNGNLTAPMNATQTDATDQLKKLIGTGSNPLRSIDNVPGANGGPAGTTQDYMNPFVDNVLKPTIRQLDINQKQNMQDNDAQANMAGAFGDTGHALKLTETKRLGTQAVGDATSKAYYDAFNSAMGQKEADINRIGIDKGQTANLISQMFGQGSQQQQTAQSGDTAKFSEFLRQQGFDETQLAKIAAIVGSLPQGTATTSPSTASSILSGVGSLAALF